MTKAKTLTLDDIGKVLNKKPVSTKIFTDEKLGLRFHIQSLSEAELAYIQSEAAQFTTDGERELAGMHLAVSIAVKKIEKKSGKSWKAIDIDRVEIGMLGETISAIPLEYVQKWSLAAVKFPLSEKIRDISDLSGGEALKLELFRPGGSGNSV